MQHNLDENTKLKGIWESQLEDIFSKAEVNHMAEFLSIVAMIMYDRFDEGVSSLYLAVEDIEVFAKIINRLSGLTITIPEREDFKDSLQIALAYYYKEVKGKDWSEIKKLFPKEENITLKAGKGIVKLNQTIKDSLDKVFTPEEEVKGILDELN